MITLFQTLCQCCPPSCPSFFSPLPSVAVSSGPSPSPTTITCVISASLPIGRAKPEPIGFDSSVLRPSACPAELITFLFKTSCLFFLPTPFSLSLPLPGSTSPAQFFFSWHSVLIINRQHSLLPPFFILQANF